MMAEEEHVQRDTRDWLERAVIGLNLCPFAKAVYVKGQVRLQVSRATDAQTVLEDLAAELQLLYASDPAAHDTTLLVIPQCLGDFLEFNDVVARAERLVRKLGFEGEIQLASFHPQFQFAGAQPDDISNYTNRSPYPTLHLLREASIDRAVAAFPDAADIYEANIEVLRRLGHQGWAALDVGRKT
jgi:hypothetical protein